MSDNSPQQKQSVPNQTETVPQWKRPAVVPQPVTKSAGPKKSILKRPVPWQMTVGAILLIFLFLFSFFMKEESSSVVVDSLPEITPSNDEQSLDFSFCESTTTSRYLDWIDGRRSEFGRIKNVYRKDGKYFVDILEAEWVVGCSHAITLESEKSLPLAEDAAIGFIGTMLENGPKAYTRLILLFGSNILSSEQVITRGTYTQVSVNKLMNILDTKRLNLFGSEDFYQMLVHVFIQDGMVTEILEAYVP